MAGLYIREMLIRRLINRVLIVPPAGLVGNWQRELEELFSLSFHIVSGPDAKNDNPFLGPESGSLIVSLDTLTGDTMFGRLQSPEVIPYDLVIFDEAHKLAADREADLSLRRTDRYRLAESLAGVAIDDDRWRLPWSARHLLLLTATPHMGKDYPYYCLWRLLEPDALSTYEAFDAFPADARKRHFVRRTKEEMVRLDATRIYPTRQTDTLGFELQTGPDSEQELYDRTTTYILYHYNKSAMLNRTAAQLAMSVFQRRLASSTYALLRSLERRLARLDDLIEGIKSKRIDLSDIKDEAEKLAKQGDLLDTLTADEEEPDGEEEASERGEDALLGGFAAATVADLEEERQQVAILLDLARRVQDRGQESKFNRLKEVLADPTYKGEKLIIFTEHRDTLIYLRQRLEALGYTGQVAEIHGGMDYKQRDEQTVFFRRPIDQGGAVILLATDAAGEGINLQFCWQMINYDVPWNPARLEQRMGRIHRYGQQHDPVLIVNLVADKTREGLVMATLLRKMETIRVQMTSDKVFDVIGRLFRNVSLRDYMALALAKGGEAVNATLESTLTKEQVEALKQKDAALFGGGSVARELPRLREDLERERLRALLPGYLRRFLTRALPLLELSVAGTLDGAFHLEPAMAGALDPLLPLLESYSEEQRANLTITRPDKPDTALFLHPGEPVFERIRALVAAACEHDALRGAIFVDPTATSPYYLHVAVITVTRAADPTYAALSRPEVVATRLVAIRQEVDGSISTSAVERLLLLGTYSQSERPSIPPILIGMAGAGTQAVDKAAAYAHDELGRRLAADRREALRATLPERLEFVQRGFQFQEAELAEARARYTPKARAGDSRARAEVTKIRARQASLASRRDQALAVPARELELIEPLPVEFIAHALVMPSDDPEERARFDRRTEDIAVGIARTHEEALGAAVQDVSTADGARRAGLEDWPGFDLLSRRPDGRLLKIEVKGRADRGPVEMTANEYARACNLRQEYWLYAVHGCGESCPTLLRVQDPFEKLLFKATGAMTVNLAQLLEAADND